MHKNLATIVATFFSLAVVTSASVLPHLGSGSQSPETMGRVFIGYNGFSGDPRPPQASTGGELGAVFYIADASPPPHL
jgi:Zn-dependent M28 family amino/carboxypeptidase